MLWHWVLWTVVIVTVAGLTLWVLHFWSYQLYKRRVLGTRKWDFNICCGYTDGGGVNADIVCHMELPRMVQVEIYRLPFADRAFGRTLCSHTMEHVDDPRQFHAELMRVSRSVTYILPPLWDIAAALNIFEHKWLVLSFKKRHVNKLPRMVKLPFSETAHRMLGQRVKG